MASSRTSALAISPTARPRFVPAQPRMRSTAMKSNHGSRAPIAGISAAFALCAMLGTQAANAAATLVIEVLDGPGVGFNEPTPLAPVGGNPGVTLGEQRLIAFETAANIWGATLTSSVPI